MKKLFMLFMLFVFNAYAADFSPTPMTITVPAQITYQFGGAPLEIPFNLSGKSGAIWLVINTHGQAEKINAVRNGYLGWHYVNKIDTTIYISQRFERDPGENKLIWDGRDENGNIPEPGEYDYYLWGYDNKSERESVCKFLWISYRDVAQMARIYEKDENGLPLSKPLIMGAYNPFWSYWFSQYHQSLDKPYNRSGTHYKWVIGSNPEDVSLLQTSICAMYYPMKEAYIPWGGGHTGLNGNPDWVSYGGPVFDPSDYNIFYHTGLKNIPVGSEIGTYNKTYYTVYKWKFVSSGEAILDQDWLGWDKGVWENPSPNREVSCYADNNFIYVNEPSWGDPYNEKDNINCIGYDGEPTFYKKFHEWYMPEEKWTGGDLNCGIDKMYSRKNNYWFLLGTGCCMHQLINTSRLTADPDDETDMVVFTNSNGDYFMDNGWMSDIKYPWYCVTSFFGNDDKGKSIYRYGISIDSNDFNLIFVNNYGIASFGVSTQDGTGIDYMTLADDTANLGKVGGQLCDSGSSYDGLYVGKKYQIGEDWEFYPDICYVAFDSAHGMITNEIAVEEKNPIQFKVRQNTPNPFNPSTTISCTVPEKGNVTIEIFNVAGQKVKTLVNGTMSAGEHSVRWDGSGCSAGVYFYKVKAGKFERTMRMTLVR
jgi:flagellar hook assembly protein FlgD